MLPLAYMRGAALVEGWVNERVRVMASGAVPRDWRKSQLCADGQCVEVATGTAGDVLMRDSKDPDGTVLSIDPATWQSFLADVRAGRFDPPPATELEPGAGAHRPPGAGPD